MGRLYLIRHGSPFSPGDEKRCLGITDVPLSPLGRLQAVILGQYMQSVPLSGLYCSGLLRARQTAEMIRPSFTEVCDLREMDAGDWDGLTFRQIRSRWPEVYALRGTDPGFPIPGSEPMEQVQLRFRRAVEQILRDDPHGEVAVVAHASVIQSFLSHVLGTDLRRCREYRLDYTGICTLEYDGGNFDVLQINRLPKLPLTDDLCEKFLTAADAPLTHCCAVADTARKLAETLNDAGIPCDADLVYRGGLLHDLARQHPDHPQTGARWLEALGYPEEAQIVRCHHDPRTEEICPQTIVFLADKLPLAQRFAKSLEKCTTDEARAAHQRRYRQALALRNKFNALCGKEIIP